MQDFVFRGHGQTGCGCCCGKLALLARPNVENIPRGVDRVDDPRRPIFSTAVSGAAAKSAVWRLKLRPTP